LKMGVEAVIATQVIDTTSVGRSLMTAVDAAAARTALSLGTLATQSGTFSGTSSGTNTGDQDLSSYLTSAAAAAAYQVILVSGTNIKTVNGSTLLGSGDLTISGLSGTGSVDNAALRADGTGGATLQNSNLEIADLLTASPNNTINAVCIGPVGGTTNVDLVLKPKGSGAIVAHVADSAATGGNKRGANAVDFQRNRFAAAEVASGSESFIGSGIGNRATGLYSSVLGGSSNNVSGQSGCALNEQNVVAGRAALAINGGNTAAGNSSFAAGTYASSDRVGMQAFAGGRFAATGDGQAVRFCLGGKTTNATPLTLRITSIASGDGGGDYTSGSASRLTIPSGKVVSALCRVCGIKSDGTAVANYVRRVVIKNLAGTTSLVGAVETIGTDIEDNAATDVAISADNTNDALQINVTGIIGETWRWVAVVEGLEIAYGT
jgi:hypothetical protein